MVKVQATGMINAPRKEIWRFITSPENFHKYIDSYYEGNFLTQNRTGLGATFRWYTKFWGKNIESTESIIKWVENERVEYEGKMAGVCFHSQMILNSAGDSTEFIIIIDYKIPYSILGKFLDLLYFRHRVKNDIIKSIYAVKDQFGRNA